MLKKISSNTVMIICGLILHFTYICHSLILPGFQIFSSSFCKTVLHLWKKFIFLRETVSFNLIFIILYTIIINQVRVKFLTHKSSDHTQNNAEQSSSFKIWLSQIGLRQSTILSVCA